MNGLQRYERWHVQGMMSMQNGNEVMPRALHIMKEGARVVGWSTWMERHEVVDVIHEQDPVVATIAITYIVFHLDLDQDPVVEVVANPIRSVNGLDEVIAVRVAVIASIQ